MPRPRRHVGEPDGFVAPARLDDAAVVPGEGGRFLRREVRMEGDRGGLQPVRAVEDGRTEHGGAAACEGAAPGDGEVGAAADGDRSGIDAERVRRDLREDARRPLADLDRPDRDRDPPVGRDGKVDGLRRPRRGEFDDHGMADAEPVFRVGCAEGLAPGGGKASASIAASASSRQRAKSPLS